MMDTKCRLETGQDRSANDCITQYSIPIVKAAIDRVITSSVQSGIKIMKIVPGCICFKHVYFVNDDV